MTLLSRTTSFGLQLICCGVTVLMLWKLLRRRLP
jgi:hypothetical protein